MSGKTFIKGTFILTAAGIATRLLGFGFRIFLSRNIGANGMGTYQLVLPVAAVCYAAGIAGLEISVSRFTAYYCFRRQKSTARAIAVLCTFFSLSLCLFCSVLICAAAAPIASYIFKNPDCTVLIRMAAASVPFACIHCMVCSYYIGMEKTGIPALSQLFEQFVRIGAVFFAVRICERTGRSCNAAVGAASLIAGEIGAASFCAAAIAIHTGGFKKISLRRRLLPVLRAHGKEISKTAVPVSVNRLALHGLQSVEAALIPLMLRLYGLNSVEAVSVYGIVTGMAMPIILFPGTLSNSVSQMLLPSMAKRQDSIKKLRRGSLGAIVFSLTFGFACIIVFVTFGGRAGAFLFGEPTVETYVKILAWLCPFIFIGSTFKSILHALGKTTRVFVNSMLSETINLACVVWLIPRYGIQAYLMGLLISQSFNAVMNVTGFYRVTKNLSQKPVQS